MFEINKVKIEQGDVLVFSYPGNVSEAFIEKIKTRAKEVFPHNEVLVLCGGLTLAVVKAA